jgi:hypothetical protein
VLNIANADWHTILRYFVDTQCRRRQRTGAPLIIRSFDCVDQTFSTFFRTFERLALSRTTELVIYGDHMFMEHNYRQLPLHHPRSPRRAFQDGKRPIVTKNVALYDFASRIMNLLRVDCVPKFPFGADLFSEAIGLPPGIAENK